jgi:DNA processing protein
LGVDVKAHKEALIQEMNTVGVLGSSLDIMYPHQNRATAEKMINSGMLISEFESGTKPDRENFPQQNRIVAGMCDVRIVVESAVQGGSMITAKLATGYNRDLMAYPGAVDAIYSGGCNHLIKSQQVHLIEGIEDLEFIMRWERNESVKPGNQKQLFVELTRQEQVLFDLIKDKPKESLDNISLNAELPVSQTSTLLLEMEFKGVVKSLPGKMYAIG